MFRVSMNGECGDQAGLPVNDGAVLALTYLQLEDVVGGLRLKIGEDIRSGGLNQVPRIQRKKPAMFADFFMFCSDIYCGVHKD